MKDQESIMPTMALWERAKMIFLSTLLSQTEKSQADRYFEMINSIEYNGSEFIIKTITNFAAETLQRDYSEKLKSSLVLAGANNYITLHFEADAEVKPSVTIRKVQQIPTASTAHEQKISSFVSTMPLNEEYTFEEFVRGPSNSFALAAATACANKPGRTGYNPLFIHGGTGLGKTHLMQAIGNELRKNDKSLSICYLTAETFLNEYVNHIKNSNLQEFRHKYRSLDVLLLDDVQFFQKGSEIQEEFFNTFQALQQAHKQIVMTSDVAPKNLPAIEARLISRFEGGMVQEIESPSYETRLAILKKKTEGLDCLLPDNVLEFIADNIKSHVRAMEGALGKVSIVHTADPTAVLSNEFMANVLKDFIEKEQTMRKLTVEEIQQAVAKKYNITMTQMLSSERTQSLVTPRQLAMYISRKLTTKSLKEIATSFQKQHATILHAVKSIKIRLENERELKMSLDEIITEFGCKISDTMD